MRERSEIRELNRWHELRAQESGVDEAVKSAMKTHPLAPSRRLSRQARSNNQKPFEPGCLTVVQKLSLNGARPSACDMIDATPKIHCRTEQTNRRQSRTAKTTLSERDSKPNPKHKHAQNTASQHTAQTRRTCTKFNSCLLARDFHEPDRCLGDSRPRRGLA